MRVGRPRLRPQRPLRQHHRLVLLPVLPRLQRRRTLVFRWVRCVYGSTARGAVPALLDVLEDCPSSQTSTSAPSTTATASTTAPTSRVAFAASAPPVTSWTRTDAAAQVKHTWCHRAADIYTASQQLGHNFLLCK